MALEFLGFFPDFAHLKGAEQLKFLPVAQANFLHIHLRRVDALGRGRHNRVTFQTARLNRIDHLPAEVGGNIRRRLVHRFPAICLGYTMSGASGLLDPETVTTITHSFQWFPHGVGIAMAARLVWISEWVLQGEAKQALAARDAERKRRLGHGPVL